MFIIVNYSSAVTYNSNPEIFVKELVDDALKTLSDKSLDKNKKTDLIEDIALKNVDIKALGMYTLGDIRKTLDADTIDKYNKLFEKYFLKV
jgi:ABC-type transporter MlaC component